MALAMQDTGPASNLPLQKEGGELPPHPPFDLHQSQ